MRFLSADWVTELGEALAATAISQEEPLVIQQLVDHADGTRGAYQVRLERGGATALVGVAEDATVTYRQSYETARGIANGELDAHVEFLLGRVTITGDTKALVKHRAALEDVAAALAELRERTEF